MIDAASLQGDPAGGLLVDHLVLGALLHLHALPRPDDPRRRVPLHLPLEERVPALREPRIPACRGARFNACFSPKSLLNLKLESIF